MKTTKALAGLLVLASALGPLESVAATALPALDVSVTRVLGAPNQRQVMLNRLAFGIALVATCAILKTVRHGNESAA